MLIDGNSALALFTNVVDCEGKNVPFKWLDTMKRTGLEIYLEAVGNGSYNEVMRADGSVASLEWTEERPFPYDILIKDPNTQEVFTNPCEHDVMELADKANKFRSQCRYENALMREIETASSRLDEKWKEENR